jgi:predicted RNA-binding protein Jag
MTTDTRTTNRDYQLPFPSNLLAADVVRLREALIAIDVDVANRPEAAAVTTEINAAIQALIGGAPGALDTLQELAAALNNDEDFANTVIALVNDARSSVEARLDIIEPALATKASLGLAIALG